MPWKYADGTLKEGREFTGTDGTQYPKVWMRYSDSEKAAIGITWEDLPASAAPYDNRFYHGRKENGDLIEKAIADVNEIDEDGKAIKDREGNQLVTLGLKSIAVAQAKKTAASMLEPYDWYVTRKSEKSTAIPSAVSTFRDAVRTACASIETAIGKCDTHAKVKALYDLPVDSDGALTGDPAPINAWPDAI